MSRISAMSQVSELTGLEFVELIQLGSEDNYAQAVSNGFTGTLQEWLATYVNVRASINQILANAGDGASAYELAVANGFVGTESEWLESLVGKSAYQAAVDLGYSGTEQEWLNSLQGKSAYEVAVDQGFVGTPSEWLASIQGINGQSAYQVALTQGFVGSEAQWLASLHGTDGESAYELAVALGFPGTEAQWIASLEGKSAYEIAVDLGYVGTEHNWLDSMRGQSAYQLAVSGGFVGSEQDWLDSLNGTPGQSAYQLAVAQGFVGNELQWIASLHGTNGQSAYEIAVSLGFSGTEQDWLDSLVGQPGQSAYDAAVEGGFVGTVNQWLSSLNGTNGQSAYLLAVSLGFEGDEQEWIDSLNGTDGQSAYALAVDQGFVGTPSEWIESLHGQSAYALAVSLGYVGTEAQWLESLIGKSAYQTAVDNGFVGTEQEWIESVPGKTAYQLAVEGGYIGTLEDWLDSLNGTPGQSAYEIAVAGGFVGTEAQWLDSLNGTDGVGAYEGAVAAGYVGSEGQFYDALANMGSAGTDYNGGVFITSITPTDPDENVTEEVYDDSNVALLQCRTSTLNITVGVLAFSGHTQYKPVVTLADYNSSVPVPLTQVPGQYGVFQGSVPFTLGVGPEGISVTHEDGAYSDCGISMDTKPQITAFSLNSPYPGSQIELKENDTMSVSLTTNMSIVAIELDNFGIFKLTEETGLSGTSHVISGLVADRGDVRTAFGFRVRVQKSTGTWSNWYTSTDLGTTELVHTAFLNNIHPTVTFGNVTYPVGQSALKGSEDGTIENTVTDFDTITYDSPGGGHIAFIGHPAVYEAVKAIMRNGGSYNYTTPNVRITAIRNANGAQTVATTVVRIADSSPNIVITTPATRLRSGGNNGTSAQNHLITLTSNQVLSQPPTLNAPEGTWLGSWTANGDNTVWTRQLQVHDDDVKGLFSWNSLTAQNEAGRVQTVIDTGDTYTIGGFVFRTINVPAYPNREAAIGTTVSDVTKLRCTNLSKAASGSLNFTYQNNTDNTVDGYTITGPTGVANPTGNLWYNADIANASSNTSGLMQIELEEVV